MFLTKLSELWSGVFIPDPDLDFVPDPGSRGQKGTGSLIRIRKTELNYYNFLSLSQCWWSSSPWYGSAFDFSLLFGSGSASFFNRWPKNTPRLTVSLHGSRVALCGSIVSLHSSRLLTLVRIRFPAFDFAADPVPAFDFDADLVSQ